MTLPRMPRESENGWPMMPVAGRLASYKEFGITWRYASLDVLEVFRAFNRDFNELVEPINPGDERTRDDWSWAPPRLIVGSAKGSNHGSGTAEDLNAVSHPRHVPIADTFTTRKIRAIRGLVREKYVDSYGHPVLRWGGDYKHAPIDGMHVEINTSPVHVAQCVRILRKDGFIK